MALITLKRSSRLLGRAKTNTHWPPARILPPFLPLFLCLPNHLQYTHITVVTILSSLRAAIHIVISARDVFSFPHFSIIEVQFKGSPAWRGPANLQLRLLTCLTPPESLHHLWMCLLVNYVFPEGRNYVFFLPYNLYLVEASRPLAMKYELKRRTYRYYQNNFSYWFHITLSYLEL